MSVRPEQRSFSDRVWLLLYAALAFSSETGVVEAATLWVQPAEGVSEYGVGRWAATEKGSATFTFALPDDTDNFVGAKIVLLPSADGWVTYQAQLALSQEGLGHDFYTDDVLVSEPIELLADQVTEVDVSRLIPHEDLLVPGQGYLTVHFLAKGVESGEVSPAAKVLGLRLEYSVAIVVDNDQTEQQSIDRSSAWNVNPYTALLGRAGSSSSVADPAAGSAKTGLQGRAFNRQTGARPTDHAVRTVAAGSVSAAIADTKLHVRGDIRVSKAFNIHEWALGTTGDSFQGTGFFFIEDQDTGALRFTIDQNTGLVSAGDVSANHLGLGVLPDSTYTLKSSGFARFDGLNGGRFEFTTPGGWPGIVGYSLNGYRREIQITNDYMWILAGDSSAAPDATHGITIRNNGDVGIGTAVPSAKLTVAGRTKTQVLEITGGADISEGFDIRAPGPAIRPLPGTVVSIDPESPGALKVSQEQYDRKVAGIISGAGGVKTGMLMGQQGSMVDGRNPVALTGRVYCHADASRSPIQPGDLLTTSDTPGHAMKVTDYEKAQGAIIGKAMTALAKGTGLVLVLVSLQ